MDVFSMSTEMVGTIVIYWCLLVVAQQTPMIFEVVSRKKSNN